MVKYAYRCFVGKEHGIVDKIAVNRDLPMSKFFPGGLSIYFYRTIRAPDNGKVNNLPPGLGVFGLHRIHDYAERLPRELVQKGDV